VHLAEDAQTNERQTYERSLTEFERFDNALRKVFSVSKEQLQRREAESRKTHKKTGPKKP
jgi:hypothetical protein